MTAQFPPKPYCPEFQAAIELLGRRWAASILRVLLGGPHRFSEMAAAVPSLSHRLLTLRLDELASAGLVSKSGTTHPEYRLTAQGADLRAAMAEIEAWNYRWLDAEVAVTRETNDPR